MSAPVAPVRVAAAVTAAVLAAVFMGYGAHHLTPLSRGLGGHGVGALAAALVARGVAERPADAAFGVLYIGAGGALPGLAARPPTRASGGR